MEIIDGIASSPGIGISEVLLFSGYDDIQVPQYSIREEDLENEFLRYEKALVKVNKDLIELKYEKQSIAEAEATFIDAHILMLSDPLLNDGVKKRVQDSLRNVESVLFESVDRLIHLLNKTGQQLFNERAADLIDIGRRIFEALANKERIRLNRLNKDIIIVARDLLPSDTLDLDKSRVLGLATDIGGTTSHTSILARAFAIPAVVGLKNITTKVKSDDLIIVDGNHGRVYVDPSEEILLRFVGQKKADTEYRISLTNLNQLPAVTRDKKHIHLCSNIESPDEVKLVKANHSNGIGLFRSEFLFLSGYTPSEEAQYNVFSNVLKDLDGQEVTIRTLDLGGDKLQAGEVSNERNPLLGWRSIRTYKSRTDIFIPHMRALLRASMHGNMRIMFPMVSSHRELMEIKISIEEIKKQLIADKLPFREDIPIGVMIEVPSAVMVSDLLAKEVDFFSIGTNDLIQYTIAADRNNEKVAYLSDQFHLGVLRLIKLTIDNAHKSGISVSMCGEMAGDPSATSLLIGLGLDGFSMSPINIPHVKSIIREINFSEAQKFAEEVLQSISSNHLRDLISGWNAKYLKDSQFPDI